ncbi:MAG: DUF86 domain-containing protein [Candidatus Lutacidiplasmatales archaeon]
MRGDALRVSDLLEAIERIRSFASGGRTGFFGDPKTSEAITFELLKIGEAATGLSVAFRESNTKVPWRRLVDLRNEIVHEYFRVELDDLWEFVVHELEGLERELRRLTPRQE